MLRKTSKRSGIAITLLVVALMLLPIMTPVALAVDAPVLNATYVVASGATVPPGPVYSSSAFKLNFSKNVTADIVWPIPNQGAITLHEGADGTGAVVPSDVARHGDGTNTDLERTNIFLTPSSALTAGATYTIRIDPSLKANNGFTIGDGNGGQPVLVTFTVSQGALATITNHLTVNPYLTLSVGDTDLYYSVTHRGDVSADSTTIAIDSNDNWTRSISWTNLTGVNHTANTIAAGNIAGISDQMVGPLSAAGPNDLTGGPTAPTFNEGLTFTYTNPASNPRADTYTGTITISATPAP